MYAATDYMEPGMLDAAYEAQERLKQIFGDKLDRPVELTRPDTSQGEYTIPYPDVINIIERNLDRLTDGGYAPSTMLPTVDWQGELDDDPRLDYTDINRWFNSVELIEQVIYGTVGRTLTTGTFSTGHNRTRHLIRTVN